MERIEKLLEVAYKNNKKVNMSDILELNLSDDEYDILVTRFELYGITISEEIEETAQKNNKKEEFVYTSDDVKMYLNEIRRIPMLTDEEEKELFLEYSKTKSEVLRKKLIESNLRLVVGVSNKYRNKLKNNLNDYLDIIQEGNAGLMRAVEKFDVTLGNKFSTYAVWWIRQKIEKSLKESAKAIKLSHNAIEVYNKIQKYKSIAEKNGEEIPSDIEIAQILGIRQSRAEEVLNSVNRIIVSTDEVVKDKERFTIIDTIQSNKPSLEEQVIDKLDFELLLNIMKNKLSLREYFVVCCKLGIVNEVNSISGDKTLQEVGNIMGVTRERIRQILEKAYRKIRKEYERITDEDYCKKYIKR